MRKPVYAADLAARPRWHAAMAAAQGAEQPATVRSKQTARAGIGEGQQGYPGPGRWTAEGDSSEDCGFRSCSFIVTNDALQFDTHTGVSPGASGRSIAPAILPDFHGFPQHLPALRFTPQT